MFMIWRKWYRGIDLSHLLPLIFSELSVSVIQNIDRKKYYLRMTFYHGVGRFHSFLEYTLRNLIYNAITILKT